MEESDRNKGINVTHVTPITNIRYQTDYKAPI